MSPIPAAPATRTRVMAAALRCFEREGFHRASMAMVIEEAGVSAGTVYRYFPSKTDLIRTCAGEVFAELGDVLAAFTTDGTGGAHEGDGPPPPPGAVVGALLTAALQIGSRYEVDMTRIAVSAWAECLRDPDLLAQIRHEYGSLRAHLGRIAAGWLPAQGPSAAGATAATGATGEADGSEDRAGLMAQALFGAVPGFIVERLLLGDVTPVGYARGLELLAEATAASKLP